MCTTLSNGLEQPSLQTILSVSVQSKNNGLQQPRINHINPSNP